ncbi:MAG: cytochrome c-type biogenesis protein CcmH [Chloroflexi bacterium]|nr:MAG: cytochrome c-type biogenesis protein CcmH [Chloroflexota bacterium]MBL1194949.1 cytochrome c-type biogenesis protein CcmH [Chloroflexota bacterium]NOH12239.1 cytochrome c-type biogenesis protein CcmH [Chloroflexota bacterium]
MMRKLILSILTILASLMAVVVVQAQDGGPILPNDDDVNAVAKQLYCPVCPNTPLDVCETQACQDWRAQIREQLTAGWTDQEIIDYFVVQYGERVLAEPNRRGFTSFVWLLPIVAVALGMIVLWQILKSWRTPQPQVPTPSVEKSISSEVLAKIEEELHQLD